MEPLAHRLTLDFLNLEALTCDWNNCGTCRLIKSDSKGKAIAVEVFVLINAVFCLFG